MALRGDHRRVAEPLVIEHPADGGPPVAVYLVPYLEPAAVGADLVPVDAPAGAEDPGDGSAVVEPAVVDDAAIPSLFDLIDEDEDEAPSTRRRSGRPTQDAVVRAAVDQVRTHAASLGPTRTVVVAHTFVAGGEVSASERDLSVGNLERVAVSTFDGFDLVALGHLHSPQSVAGDRVAYAGSPLPYSFSEEGQVKSVRLVDLAPDGSVTATVLPLGVGRPVRTLAGRLEELLSDPALAGAEEARVRVRLTDEHLPNQAMARLRQRFPHAAELRHEPGGVVPTASDAFASSGELRLLEPLDLALRFWKEQDGAPADDDVQALLSRALADASTEAVS
ncbi:MAG: exonuclease SbcCD subunit D C-terminal domain-containing protein [Actinobacteria bacterium]|nr:exonuclease SbcCD subunit D C-terminal domain-containing protein [Actinomycetota bacterium]